MIRTHLTAHPVLLLLEDAEDADFLANCLPERGPSAILITSRDPDLAHMLARRRPGLACRTFVLAPFSAAENRALFQVALGDHYHSADETHYDAIGALLDFQPAALRLALNGLAFPSHLNAAALQAKLERGIAPAHSEVTSSELGPRPLEVLFELVASTLDPSERQALTLLAQCAPGPVPLAFLSRMTETDADELQESFEQLARSHWCTASAGSYELHELLRCLVRGQEPNPDLDRRFLRAVYDLYDGTDLDQFLLKDACLPQLRQALALWQNTPPTLLHDLVLDPFYPYCQVRGHGTLYLAVAELALKVLPENLNRKSIAQKFMIMTLVDVGRLEEAMVLCHVQLALCEELGFISRLIDCYESQAMIFLKWGRYEEAMAVLHKQQSLSEGSRNLIQIAELYRNQALVLQQWGRHEEAQKQFQKHQAFLYQHRMLEGDL